ncbi:Cysteine/Histidine-rich C1 domain family protein [Raphanus sativus]|nr:Cysteine/Histidine-rich C1 domain family protein [Raphanus sativus]
MDTMTLTSVYKPSVHLHPLFPSSMFVNTNCGCCNVKETIYGGYYCNDPTCYDWFFHKKCVEAPLEINHPCHPGHLLLLTGGFGPFDGCDLCGNRATHPYYSCSTCEFKVDLNCGMKPSPYVIEHPLCHDHPLAFLKRRILESPCEVCKEEIWGPSYLCQQCNLYFHVDCVHLSEECAFLVHGKCIDLPRVININRHDHRISFTHHLGAGYSKCGICRKSLSQYHGAYSCSLCPNYVVHCRCAVHSDIWDNRELECIPNYDTDKFIAPFKVVGDDLIDHFSHEKHPLKMYKNNIIYDKWLQCEACIHPPGFEFIYGCEQCGFFLHEKCANLPMKKRLVSSPTPYSLEVVERIVNSCIQCGVLFDGFKYTTGKRRITDVVVLSVNRLSMMAIYIPYILVRDGVLDAMHVKTL